MTRSTSRATIHVALCLSLLLVLGRLWQFWALMCAVVCVLTFLASYPWPRHEQLSDAQLALRAALVGTPALGVETELSDTGCQQVLACITDRREGADSLQLLVGAALSRDDSTLTEVAELLDLRARRLAIH